MRLAVVSTRSYDEEHPTAANGARGQELTFSETRRGPRPSARAGDRV